MNDYLRRAREALTQFAASVDAFDAWREANTGAAALPAKAGTAFADIAGRLRTAVRRLEHSLTQIAGETALDVVDLQVRMEGESAQLAAALKSLGELLAKAPGILAPGGPVLYDLEESAERVAAALFPSTIEGTREINRSLWDFRPIWNEYTRVLSNEVAKPSGKGLTGDQLARVEQTATQLRDRFEAVNALLNQLHVGPSGSGPSVQALIREARQSLAAAVRDARSKAADAYKPFHAVLKRAESLARKVDGQFEALRVPVFPDVTVLEEAGPIVDAERYAALSGVERFALLNISARLRSVGVPGGGGHLLAPAFAIRVFDVFPDRLYFTAAAGFIDALRALEQAGVFEEAPASLHRFRDGSFKQRTGKKGNLQVSYAFGTDANAGDRTTVRVDADIDLYRSPTRHLFGEVLVNHLTGRKTDQFKVWDILASGAVKPIGGFSVVTV